LQPTPRSYQGIPVDQCQPRRRKAQKRSLQLQQAAQNKYRFGLSPKNVLTTPISVSVGFKWNCVCRNWLLEYIFHCNLISYINLILLLVLLSLAHQDVTLPTLHATQQLQTINLPVKRIRNKP
jgi:hypothetical protein